MKLNNKKVDILKSFIKNNYWYLFGPLIVILQLMIVFAIKGVYPFGERTVSYYDMAQSIIPHYYHTYDVLHFNKDIFLEWNSSFVTSLASEVGRFVVFPLNIFFYFVKRNNILNSMSIFVTLKFAFAAFFMEIYCYSRKQYKVLSIVCSVAYALCGMAIQFYSTIVMLDDLLIFPLLMFSFIKLIDNKNKWLYVLCLSIIFTFNQHTIFFVCFFLLMYSFISLKDKDKIIKRVLISRILICSIISLMISGFVFVPNLLQLLNSSRVGSIHRTFLEVLKCVATEYQGQKNFMLYTCEFVLPLILLLVLSKKFNKYKLNIALIVLLSIPILYESVDLMWHLGSYESFPMRFGFILSFACLDLLVNAWDDININNKFVSKYFPLISISILPVVVIVNYKICSYFVIYGILDCELYKNYWMIIVGMIIFYFGVFVCKNPKLKICLMMLMIVCQTSIGVYGFLAPESDMYPESSEGYIYDVIDNESNFSDIRGIDNRLKDVNFKFNTNYSFLSQTASGSGWVSGTKESVVLELIRLGYDQIYIRTLDCGGTALTDLCLGYKYIYDKNSNDSSLYTRIEEKDNVYSCNYTIPFGFIIEDNSLVNKTVGFQHQNELFYAIGGNGVLFNVLYINEIPFEYDEEMQDNYLDFEFQVDGKSELYIYGSPTSEYDYEIYINDEVVNQPYLYVDNSIYFPNFDRNGIIDCGTFENETVKFTFRSYSSKLGEDIEVALMDYATFENLVQKKNEEISISKFDQKFNSLEMNFVSSVDGQFVLPIGFSDNWIIRLNGDRIEYSDALNGAFVSIPVKKGNNNLYLKFRQKGLILGTIISIIGLGLLLIYIIVSKKIDIKISQPLNNVIYILYLVVTVLLISIVYIIPIVVSTYTMITSNVNIIEILTFVQ